MTRFGKLAKGLASGVNWTVQTPLRALLHFLTVGWKKHMPGVKEAC